MRERVEFHSVSGAYGEFSNFAAFPIRLDGKCWPTSEHRFQAMKFEDGERRERVRRAKTAWIAAQRGRDRKQRIRRDWGSVKLDVMREAVWAKFTQHRVLRELLLSTGEAHLVERSPHDRFWGDGGDGRGKNWLGRILMETRARLQAGPASGAAPGPASAKRPRRGMNDSQP